MLHLQFKIRCRRRVGVLVVTGILLALCGMTLSASQIKHPQARLGPLSTDRPGRHYYLTDADYKADEPLTACAEGYHMASLWEILDPSNLIYRYDHPDAHTKDDSGQGPPSHRYGWVRTGGYSSTINTAGVGNCSAWTSTDEGDYGVCVLLSRTWETPPGEIGGVWDATSFRCSVTAPVWCVEDFYERTVYLPLIVDP